MLYTKAASLQLKKKKALRKVNMYIYIYLTHIHISIKYENTHTRIRAERESHLSRKKKQFIVNHLWQYLDIHEIYFLFFFLRRSYCSIPFNRNSFIHSCIRSSVVSRCAKPNAADGLLKVQLNIGIRTFNSYPDHPIHRHASNM